MRIWVKPDRLAHLGITIPEIIAAIRATGGTIVTVDDQETLAAQAALAAQGLFVEPTSAVCYAAIARARRSSDPRDPLSSGEVVQPLCGSGLKTVKPCA